MLSTYMKALTDFNIIMFHQYAKEPAEDNYRYVISQPACILSQRTKTFWGAQLAHV